MKNPPNLQAKDVKGPTGTTASLANEGTVLRLANQRFWGEGEEFPGFGRVLGPGK